jgi:biopolymer transport protein ExbB/TolQ
VTPPNVKRREVIGKALLSLAGVMLILLILWLLWTTLSTSRSTKALQERVNKLNTTQTSLLLQITDSNKTATDILKELRAALKAAGPAQRKAIEELLNRFQRIVEAELSDLRFTIEQQGNQVILVPVTRTIVTSSPQPKATATVTVRPSPSPTPTCSRHCRHKLRRK